MTNIVPFSSFTPFSTTTIIAPRSGGVTRAVKVEKAKLRPAAPKTGRFGLAAEPRPVARKIEVKAPPPPAAAQLYVHNGQSYVRSEVFEHWLDEAARRVIAQKPGRMSGSYALEIVAPRTTRTRHFGVMERPLIELLMRCRVITAALSPDRLSVSYGELGGELSLTLTEFSAP
ncbi:hypothetical protein CCR94_18785 [Rhodoblastus sphagnicola]|uniref:Uncharacterized protein n=1 Tax=Rhodoblastus sphagnicola TaxID=333368 RepID=A0A2S6N0E7_9HYPH|nr:hypothetical protein [Rhodoblastus sphagnicola]MBB4198581.1 hypothetical protein [Rhodoblastus sphagnicola]PPQ28094.1 hypothetical protein CCR94_18785 [Rhodoblastus sphagnicola]